MAEPLDAQQASVGGEADLFQVIEVAQPSADGGVVGVVDDGLGAQCAPFLVVLLDARAFVVHVQRRSHSVGNDAGAIPRGRAFGHAAMEDQLHVVRACQRRSENACPALLHGATVPAREQSGESAPVAGQG